MNIIDKSIIERKDCFYQVILAVNTALWVVIPYIRKEYEN